jgi:Icc-related predicted phosphoesterase
MKLLVLADVHGEYERLGKILDNIRESFDVVVCPGDFTDMFNTPKDFSQTDVANIVLQKLLATNKPVLCVPGNQDPYEILGLFDDYGVNIHGKARAVGGITFAGWGGAKTPFGTTIEPSEKETKDALDSMGPKLKPGFVLVVHAPPKDTKLDRIETREHVGSKSIREFIMEKSPALAISAHVHESHGTDKLKDTTLFYPGPVFEGYYGIVEIKGGKVSCEAKKTTF